MKVVWFIASTFPSGNTFLQNESCQNERIFVFLQDFCQKNTHRKTNFIFFTSPHFTFLGNQLPIQHSRQLNRALRWTSSFLFWHLFISTSHVGSQGKVLSATCNACPWVFLNWWENAFSVDDASVAYIYWVRYGIQLKMSHPRNAK